MAIVSEAQLQNHFLFDFPQSMTSFCVILDVTSFLSRIATFPHSLQNALLPLRRHVQDYGLRNAINLQIHFFCESVICSCDLSALEDQTIHADCESA
jgi:hypothetical protein